MEILCSYCGHKACNEVKCIGSSSTAKANNLNREIIEAKGTRICFNITTQEDLFRNILKVKK